MDIILNSYLLLGVFTLSVSLIPFFICLKYGRDPKIDYSAKYEVDLPADDPPAIVNAVCVGKPEFGFPNSDGFRATILDLIDRNYLILKNESSNKIHYPGSLLMKINPDYDPDTLWEFEIQVLNFLKEYEQDGIISMDLVLESLKHVKNTEPFLIKYEKWREEVKNTLLNEDGFGKAFYSRGDDYLKKFGISGIIGTFLIIYLDCFHFFSETLFIYVSILWAISVISLILPKKIAGQWTPYGKEYFERWMGFKRYVEDYSLIEEYPSESVKVWNKYLVYATALGAAKEVRKEMWLSISEKRLEGAFI